MSRPNPSSGDPSAAYGCRPPAGKAHRPANVKECHPVTQLLGQPFHAAAGAAPSAKAALAHRMSAAVVCAKRRCIGQRRRLAMWGKDQRFGAVVAADRLRFEALEA